jgi:hypothetical protein
VLWAQPYNVDALAASEFEFIGRAYRTGSWGVVAGLVLEAA